MDHMTPVDFGLMVQEESAKHGIQQGQESMDLSANGMQQIYVYNYYFALDWLIKSLLAPPLLICLETETESSYVAYRGETLLKILGAKWAPKFWNLGAHFKFQGPPSFE